MHSAQHSEALLQGDAAVCASVKPYVFGGFVWTYSYVNLPKTRLKSLGRKFRVPDGVLDSAVAQVMLNRAGIYAFVGQVKPTGMTKHVFRFRGR